MHQGATVPISDATKGQVDIRRRLDKLVTALLAMESNGDVTLSVEEGRALLHLAALRVHNRGGMSLEAVKEMSWHGAVRYLMYPTQQRLLSFWAHPLRNAFYYAVATLTKEREHLHGTLGIAEFLVEDIWALMQDRYVPPDGIDQYLRTEPQGWRKAICQQERDGTDAELWKTKEMTKHLLAHTFK